MPFTHTPTTMMPDNSGAWYSRSEVAKLIDDNRDLRNANRILMTEQKAIKRHIRELTDLIRADRKTPSGEIVVPAAAPPEVVP